MSAWPLLTARRARDETLALRAPARNPAVCGALGAYDEAALDRIRRELGADVRIVYESGDAALAADREPLRWRHGHTRGFAFPELPLARRPRIGSWKQAACDADSVGLVLAARERFVHSSGSGVAPVYFLSHAGATYFAARIDALVRGLGIPLRPDWQAWASILTMVSPVGERTPFERVRRLRQCSRLWHAEDGARTHSGTWPWAEVEPTATVEEGAGAVIERLQATVSAFGTPTAVLLSGGLDSRVLAAAAAREHADGVVALTHASGPNEARAASAVAKALGLRHEIVRMKGPEQYWRIWVERVELSDFQFLADVWIAPLLSRASELALPLLDGLAFDALGTRGDRYYRAEMFGSADARKTARRLWAAIQRRTLSRAPTIALGRDIARAAAAASRREFVAEAKPFHGHRNLPILLFYATRTTRGASVTPSQVLGARAPVWSPFASSAVAQATLAIDPLAKMGGRLHRAVLAEIGPAIAGLPTAAELPRGGPKALSSPLNRTPLVVAELTGLLTNPAIRDVVSPQMQAAIADGELVRRLENANWRRAIFALAHLSLWQRRYEPLLEGFDARELLAVAD